jgi:hypothetical protein
MTLTIKAILARFNQDRNQAIAYAKAIASTYPHLQDEYTELAQRIMLDSLN